MNKALYNGRWYELEGRTNGFYLFGSLAIDLDGKILNSKITKYMIYD